MKVEELMVGDLVCYDKANNYYTQIKEIKCTHDIPYDVVYYIKGMRDRRDRLWIEFEETFVIDILSPIPLSAEILEKNGFEYINDEYGCWLLGKIELREREPYNGLFEVEINIAKETIYIHYLHELQHALKLCKSQKKIVL